jgi:hypothetical protein
MIELSFTASIDRPPSVVFSIIGPFSRGQYEIAVWEPPQRFGGRGVAGASGTGRRETRMKAPQYL